MDHNDQIEALGELVDTCDNYLELQKNDFMAPAMKLDAAVTGLESVRDRVKEIYVELGGEDVWSDRP